MHAAEQQFARQGCVRTTGSPVVTAISTAIYTTTFTTIFLLTAVALAPAARAQAVETSPGEPTDEEQTTDQDAAYADRITVTATGEAASVEGLPVSVSVLTREEIENTQEETVVDLVRRIPGVTVSQTGDRGGSASFFLRGTESDHVLALFDGVRLNSPYFAGYDFSTLSSAGIERIEVARGPFSALWGSDAVGGVVNIIPVRGHNGSHGRLLGEAGDDAWQRLEATWGWGDGDWDVFASAHDREGRGTLPNSDFASRQLLLDAGFSWSEESRLAILYQDLDGDLELPFSTPGIPTPDRRQDSQQQLLALPLSFQPSARWSLEATPSLVERELFFRDPDDPFGFTSGDTFADTTQVRFASRHDVADDHSHELAWGGEWREDRVDAASNFGIDLNDETVRLRGVFAQDVWRASERLTVIAGLRYDDTDDWGSELSPKLSLGYEASASVELRASYGEAFRQPAVGELFFPFSGNPDLEPERSQSAELGVAVRHGKQRIDAAFFATDTEEMIDFDFITFRNVNIAAAEIRGFELSWSLPVTGSLQSTLQATWLDTENQDGLALLRRPEWGASWTLDGRLGDRLRGDVALFFTGDRADIDATTFVRTEAGSYATVNLAVAYRVAGELELTARVQNLADRDYEEVSGYPAPGRRVLAGLRWSR